MASNAVIRQKVNEIQAQAKVDREWWDKKRASIQSEFMKELDEGAPVSSSSTSRPATSGGEKVGSDEDTVLVEGGGPTSPPTPATGGGTKGVSKKKKGKK